MQKANVADIKNNLSRYLAYVKRGGRVRIFSRRTPVAELVPVSTPGSTGGDDPDDPMESRLQRLAFEGIVSQGSGCLQGELLQTPPSCPGGVLDALLEERRNGR